jgi:hypothetical protein
MGKPRKYTGLSVELHRGIGAQLHEIVQDLGHTMNVTAEHYPQQHKVQRLLRQSQRYLLGAVDELSRAAELKHPEEFRIGWYYRDSITDGSEGDEV